MHQKSLFGDQKSKKNSGEGHPTPYSLGACGASAQLAPSFIGLPKLSHSPKKLAVSRIDAECDMRKGLSETALSLMLLRPSDVR